VGRGSERRGAARTAQHGEAHELHRRGAGEHYAADLARAHAAFEIERVREGDAGELAALDVRERRGGGDIDGRGPPVGRTLVEHFLEARGDRFEIVAGEAAVGREAFGEDQEIAALLRERVVIEREEAADIRQTVLLRRHQRAVREAEHLLGDLFRRAAMLSRLALPDEPRVFRETAGVEEERLSVAMRELAHAAQIFERDRLSSARIVRHRHHHHRHPPAFFIENALERLQVHVALERMDERRLPPFRDHQIARRGAFMLDIRARRIEVNVVQHHVTDLQRGMKEDALRSAALMGGDDVFESREIADDVLEPLVRSRAGVRLVALHQRAPLRRRHRAGAGVGEEKPGFRECQRAHSCRCRCSVTREGPATNRSRLGDKSPICNK